MAKVTKANYAAKLKAAILNAAITGKLTGGTTGWKTVKGKSLFEETKNKKPQGEYFDYIDIDAVDNKRFKIVGPKHLRCEEAPSRASRGVKEGDVLFSMVRPYLRNIALVEEKYKKCIASTGFFVCRSKFYEPKFLFWLMLSPYVIDGLTVCMKGDNSPSVRKDDILEFDFPLPPLDVQREIVGKVEELMPLVEEYGRAEEARQKLDTEFPEKLRKSILDLAIHGKLVAQDPAEPPAAIGASVTTPPYALPPNWKWVKLGEVCDLISGVSYKKNDITDSGIRILRGGNLKEDHNIYLYDDDVFLPSEYASTENTLRKKDIVVVNSTGSATVIGRPAIVKEDLPNTQIGAFLRIVRVKAIEMADWVAIIFCSSFYKSHIQEVSKGTSIKNLKSEYFLDFTIPLPPLGEQKRIVEKVEAMMKALEGLSASV